MLDHEDQQQLERCTEKRNNAVHRTISMIIFATGAIVISEAIHNVYGYLFAYVAMIYCLGYCLFLLYHIYTFHKVARQLKQQAKYNAQEFTNNMEAFLESVGKQG